MTLNSEIEQSAQDPKRMRVDGNEVEQHSLQDQIAADQYLREQSAQTSKTKLPIRFAKLRPDGTV